MTDSEQDREPDAPHNPGEPTFGEGHGGEHNPGEPQFGEADQGEAGDAAEAADNAEGHS